MSHLIHRLLTWSIVATVVLMAGWLSNNVQSARTQGLRIPSAHGLTSPAAPAVAKAPLQAQAGKVTLR